MSGGERWLIVNADDLGRTRGLNAGIFAAHRRGIVTSATLMVGFEAAAEAASSLAGHPDLGVGLHVTLTGARPTLPAERVPSLVGAEGRFAARPELLGELEPAEVLDEARHQLSRFRELTGRLPTHLDSHHHSHRHPAILRALIEIAREHSLPVRNSSPEIGVALRAAGVPTTDRFIERFFDDGARLDTLLEILESVGPGVTELMCHPGRVDAELTAGSSYAAPREREIDLLTDPRVAEAVERLGLQLTRFDTACAC